MRHLSQQGTLSTPASLKCLIMSTKTGLSGSLERCSYSCQAWLDSLIVFVPVPTSCPSYCAKQAKCEGDQCRAKSRHVTPGATMLPRARQMEEQTQGNTWAIAQRLGVDSPGAMFTKVTECCECQNSSKCQSPTGLRYTENGRLGSILHSYGWIVQLVCAYVCVTAVLFVQYVQLYVHACQHTPHA